MPELPEVEVTRRGIAPHLVGRRVKRVVVRQPQLRWPVPRRLGAQLVRQRIRSVGRRGKYLWLETARGSVILHLGMSGSLRVVAAGSRPGPYDRVEIVLAGGRALQLRDPRRFGAVLWTRADPETHPLIRELGPEPLGDAFDGDYLHRISRGRRGPIKAFLMNGRVVAGIGNIYASEALFRAGIHPFRSAGRISLGRYRRLAEAIRAVLARAIARGGTTLRDFRGEGGEPGYFRRELRVYGRAGEPCRRCGHLVERRAQAQRATYYCSRCQR